MLATNTSSLSVTALAAGVPGPERVVGMHFFNPPPVMKLLEVVAGERSGEAALARARAAGEAMGKTVIAAADGPGFLVNRCNRPFALEGLRLVEQRIATPEQVDRICRMAGGFKMGPFELMDLVGVDVGFTISKSFFEQSFHEPRWRPSPLAARAVAAGRHGRKTGEGWYRYPDGPPPDPEPPEPGGGDGLIVVAGESELAEELAEAANGAGWDVAAPEDADGEVPFLLVDCGGHDAVLQGGPQLLLCDAAPLAAQDPGGPSAGFHLLPPFGRLAELTAMPSTAPATLAAAERLLRDARDDDRAGRRRARPRARPDRRAARQRGVLRGRRGRRGPGGRRRGDGPRPQPPARPDGVGRRDRRRRGARAAHGAAGGVPRGALPTRPGAAARRQGGRAAPSGRTRVLGVA